MQNYQAPADLLKKIRVINGHRRSSWYWPRSAIALPPPTRNWLILVGRTVSKLEFCSTTKSERRLFPARIVPL